MGGGKNRRGSATSSSGSEDGDADWRIAIDSIASTTAFTSSSANSNGKGVPYSRRGRGTADSPASKEIREDKDETHKPQNIKHYQIKAQKLLDDILERTIEVVRHTDQPISEKDPTIIEGVRLFKHAPRGIVFDHLDELEGPKKKPRILPGEEVDEKSKTFRKQVQSIAIDGTDIIAAATAACKKSLSKLEAREADAKAAAKREEERVAKMKSVRGERWLPSMAREMQTKTQCPR
ncbi:Hypothetical predicted protein [Olea europaea subsp. europaea]|uniref:Uncharacterized protein n=1 Tax=Olea europaea subsp. europaea TaxID=158383 RepID=A0A8S0VGP0_OLEEU|nr:Hypothetical predicted protein [Olea europaea subsp. europaea]